VSLGAAHAFPGRNGRLLLLTCDPSAEAQDRVTHFRSITPAGRDFRTIAKFKESTPRFSCNATTATWSPDGRTILYDQGSTLWTMRHDGRRRRKIMDDAFYPAWSPNGREVAFMRLVPGGIALFKARRDGTRPRQLTPAMESAAWMSWSPTGRIIALTRWEEDHNSIWTVRADGTGFRRVVEDGRWPSWSPNGRRIIFADGKSVLTMDPDGRRRRRVTPVRANVEVVQAAFSPDGRKIAFVRIDRREYHLFRAWVMNADGSKPHFVSPRDALVLQVDWRPVRP
jgi:Tol biopolymer transport system component